MNAFTPGDRFGSLVYLKRISSDQWNAQRGLFQCDCGAVIELIAGHVKRGQRQKCKQCATKDMVATKIKHGARYTREYACWAHMIDRCENNKYRMYKDYGGRGITVCERWHSFELFLADMGKRPSKEHSIERTDNLKGYSPDNCIWATRLQQSQNKRNNCYVMLDGERMCVSEASRRLGIKKTVIATRVRYHGVTHQKALEDARHELAALGIETKETPR